MINILCITNPLWALESPFEEVQEHPPAYRIRGLINKRLISNTSGISMWVQNSDLFKEVNIPVNDVLSYFIQSRSFIYRPWVNGKWIWDKIIPSKLAMQLISEGGLQTLNTLAVRGDEHDIQNMKEGLKFLFKLEPYRFEKGIRITLISRLYIPHLKPLKR